MALDNDTAAWLRLTLIPGLGPRTLRAGLHRFGSASAFVDASPGQWRDALGEAAAIALAKGPDPDALPQAERWLTQSDTAVVALDDPRYPPSLLETPDPPFVLYACGNLPLLVRPGIAIVGSRSATTQGLRNAEAFAQALGDAGLTIVSGLALGIDAAAHRGGLASPASTIAIVGTGADRIYPARNKELARRIRAQGLVLSEFPLGTPPLLHNFPRRNRLISGLARGCLVVEAAMSSGSLITARLAADQGRDVFAIPGSIHSPVSKGCHTLIKQGAKLVESAEDVLEELGMIAPRSGAASVSHESDPLLDQLGYEPVALDILCTRLGLTPDVVSAMLLALELDGKVEALAGGRYQRLA